MGEQFLVKNPVGGARIVAHVVVVGVVVVVVDVVFLCVHLVEMHYLTSKLLCVSLSVTYLVVVQVVKQIVLRLRKESEERENKVRGFR